MKVFDRERAPADDGVLQVTPFLFIPQDASDIGVPRPLPTGVGWIDSPSIFLLSEDGRLELSPRYGVYYRVVVLIGNSGAVPAESCFAEFYLDSSVPAYRFSEDPKAKDGYYAEQTDFQPSPRTQSLGMVSFSVGQSISGGEVSWAISPENKKWKAGSISPSGFTSQDCLYVRVYDLIHDAPSSMLLSWADRKVASKILTWNFAGVWAGDEIDSTGQNLGKIRLELIQDEWSMYSLGYGASLRTCTLVMKDMPKIEGRETFLDVPMRGWTAIGMLRVNSMDGTWFADFKPRGVGVMDLSLSYSGQTDYGKTSIVLSLEKATSSAPAPDVSILQRVKRIVPSCWPPSRKADAKIFYSAIESL